MAHLPTPGLLGGDLAGTLPNPKVLAENLLDGIRALLPHQQAGPDVQAGAGIAVTRNAQGYLVVAVIEQLVDGLKALLPHPQYIPDVRAGSNVTVTRDARGYTVASAGGGASWTEVEFDFGAAPLYNKQFTITDAAITDSSKKVIVVPSGNAPTGGQSDEWEFDSIQFAALAAAGSATVYTSANPGPVSGKRKAFYTVA